MRGTAGPGRSDMLLLASGLTEMVMLGSKQKKKRSIGLTSGLSIVAAYTEDD